MNRRTILGFVCLAVSLLLFFFVFPLIRSEEEAVTTVYVAARTIGQGEQLSEKDFTIKEVHASDVPQDVVEVWPQANEIYAKTAIMKGAFVQESMLSSQGQGAEDVLRRMEEGDMAISITLSNMAAGVSGKIMNGDTVSLFVVSGGIVSMPKELSRLTVITTTTSGGIDADQILSDEDGKKTMPSTLTLLVNETQARKIIEAEASGDLYVVLVSRGGNQQ